MCIQGSCTAARAFLVGRWLAKTGIAIYTLWKYEDVSKSLNVGLAMLGIEGNLEPLIWPEPY